MWYTKFFGVDLPTEEQILLDWIDYEKPKFDRQVEEHLMPKEQSILPLGAYAAVLVYINHKGQCIVNTDWNKTVPNIDKTFGGLLAYTLSSGMKKTLFNIMRGYKRTDAKFANSVLKAMKTHLGDNDDKPVVDPEDIFRTREGDVEE